MKPLFNKSLVALVILSGLIFSYGLWVTGHRVIVIVWIIVLGWYGIGRAMKYASQRKKR